MIILEGVFAAWSPEGFESGIGGWWADNGAWEVGVPASNPATASEGTHVAGTAGGTTYGVAKGVKLYAVRVLNCSFCPSTVTTSPRIRCVAGCANEDAQTTYARMRTSR